MNKMENLKQRTKIIVINGLGGCGKSSFTGFFDEFCIKAGVMSDELSSVDFVKEVAVYCGWRGEKEQQDRQFLHDIKVALTKWRNIPNLKVIEELNSKLNTAKHFYSHFKGYMPFVNIRESEYIKNFIELCHNNGYNNIRTLLILNHNIHSTEAEELINDILYGYKYDDTITNDGDLDDLGRQAKTYFDKLFSESV